MPLDKLLIFIPSAVVAYLAGSVPFGLYIGRLKGIDIRAHGSGNIGATNVWRVCGKPLGVLCFVLDVVKGLVPVLAGGYVLGALGRWSPDPAVAWLWLGVAAATIAGHMFPLWLKGRGGKGVATGFGALLGLWPLGTAPTLLALVMWIVVARVSRYVSLASIGAALTLPVGVLIMVLIAAVSGDRTLADAFSALSPVLVVTLGLALVVIWKHRGNLKRIQEGVEPRLGDHPRPAPADHPERAAPAPGDAARG